MEVKEHFMKEAHAFVKEKHIEEIANTQKKGIVLNEMEKKLILLGYKHGFSHGVFHGRESLLNIMNEQ